MSLVFSVGQESTGSRQAFCWRYMAAPEVARREDLEADEGDNSHGETPNGVEAG